MNPVKRVFGLIAAPVKKGRSFAQELFKKPQEGEKGKGKNFFIVGFIITIIMVIILSFSGKRTSKSIRPKEIVTPTPSTATKPRGDAFISSGDNTVVIKQMEDADSRLKRQIDDLKSQISESEKTIEKMSDRQKKMEEYFKDLDEAISAKVIKALRSEKVIEREGVSPQGEGEVAIQPAKIYEPAYANIPLKVYDVAPLKPSPADTKEAIYLPSGSFVNGTLLSGVYAPMDEARALPVLISIDEAFYGPNQSRIPLKGCFAIGKAAGDATTDRAHIQVYKLSMVLPNGQTFEKEGNCAFIVGEADSTLALDGVRVSRSKEQMMAAFSSGAFAGAGATLERGQISQYESSFGQVTTAKKAAAGEILGGALHDAFTQMAQYQIRQLEKMVDAIYVAPGRKVYIVMTEGVRIEGLQSSEVRASSHHHLD